jgi:hypothetical protein
MTWPSSGPSSGSAQAPLNGLSVDVEDWFQVGAFETVIDRGDWDGLVLPCRAQLRRDPAHVRRCRGEGTFFTLGWVAQRYPAMIRRIADEGHEIASHGWDHARVFTLGARPLPRISRGRGRCWKMPAASA